LDNAREALPGRGTVALAARVACTNRPFCRDLEHRKSESFVEISVTDTGAGLPAELERRLSAEFFYSTKPRHHGLGLAIVRAIVHAYGGGLRFGRHAEKGAAVQVFLPVATSLSSNRNADMPIITQAR